MATIALLDFGFGNVLSVETALREAGGDVERIEHGATLHAYEAAVLTGVGAFGAAMRAFETAGMFSGLWNFYEELKRPIMGIGLGYQMLLSGSGESPGQPGLNILPATARSFPSDVPKPFVQTAELTPVEEDPIFDGVPADTLWQFNCDHYVPYTDSRMVSATFQLGRYRTVAAMRRGSVWGLQFDPSRSGTSGRLLLGNFARLVAEITAPLADRKADG